MRTLILPVSWAIVALAMTSCGSTRNWEIDNGPAATAGERARAFIAEHEETVRPLEIALNRAWWDANTTGKDEAFKAKEEAQNRLDAVLADPKRLARLEGIRKGLSDPAAGIGEAAKWNKTVLMLSVLEGDKAFIITMPYSMAEKPDEALAAAKGLAAKVMAKI